MSGRMTLSRPIQVPSRIALAAAVVIASQASGCGPFVDPNVSSTGKCGNRNFLRLTAERRELLTSDTTKVIVETFSQGSYAPEVQVQLSATGGRFGDSTSPLIGVTTDTTGIGSAIWRAPSVVGLGSEDRGPWKYDVEASAFDECSARVRITVRR